MASRCFVVVLLAAFCAAVPAVGSAQQVGSVAGTVMDPYGESLAGVTVEIVSVSGYRFEAQTDSFGRYQQLELAPGGYAITFALPGHSALLDTVRVRPGDTFLLNVRMEPIVDSGLGGQVVDETGLGLPGVVVALAYDGSSAVHLVTNDEGRFLLSPARPGSWLVTAEMSGFHAAAAGVQVVYSQLSLMRLEMALDYAVSETVVVVGTRRAEGRPTVTDSPVPVDVFTAEDLRSQPMSDMPSLVRALSPSFNVNTQPISDAATAIRPVNFRNLAPDHMLVLVNGKRRHRGAVIAWLGNGLSDGSQGPDLSTIPAIAVRQVELLRDGAAAQYGSDAIAGVINFELKDAPEGGTFEVRHGLFGDLNAGDPATCGGVGQSCAGIGSRASQYSVAGNVGLPMGNSGFLNLSLEYGEQDPTNRAVQREDAAMLGAAGGVPARDTAQVWGNPQVQDNLKVFVNAGALLPGGFRPYAHGNYARRTVTGGFYYRHPHTRGGVFRGPVVDGDQTLLVGDRAWADTGVPGAGGCPVVSVVDARPDAAALAAVEADPDCFTLYSRFPGGFAPQFGGTLDDQSVVAGVRQLFDSGFTWDLSASLGRSRIRQFIHDTVNASLGYGTPTSFDPGSYAQEEFNLNADVTVPIGSRVHLGLGAERRTEWFTIGAGDSGSWTIGPYAEQGFSSGSNGFNGYRPDTTAGTWGRTSHAAYADLELTGADREWSIGTAARFEHFDDFGSTLNGKLTFRYSLTDAFSVRAAASTGFRAPTPGQQNTFNVTTAFIDGQLLNNGVVPSTSGVALARGGRPLQPETSRNYSGGVVYDRGPMQLSADLFRIDVADRLAVSQEIRLRSDEIDVLLSEGIAEARNFPVFRFFLNDFSTSTYGVDLVWSLRSGDNRFRAAWNHTTTDVHDVRSHVINSFRISTLERGLPVNRWSASAARSRETWRATARAQWFGGYWDSEDARNAAALGSVIVPELYSPYAGRALLDVEGGYRLGPGLWAYVGVQNLLNTYPEVNPYGPLTVGNRYGQFSPFGFDGAYYYARLSSEW